jgi:hypothetical protein
LRRLRSSYTPFSFHRAHRIVAAAEPGLTELLRGHILVLRVVLADVASHLVSNVQWTN